MTSLKSKIFVNGQLTDQIPVADRGLNYGHGLFETIRFDRGIPFLWERHLARLKHGCKCLGIVWSDYWEQQLRQEAEQLSDNYDAIIKIIITAGSGGRGYRPPETQHPLTIVMCHPLPVFPKSYAEQGIAVSTCSYRLSEQAALAGIKHLNRLDQVLASSALSASEYTESIMLDQQDQVIEGTRTNLFGVTNGELVTPLLNRCGVAGVMRECVMEQAKLLRLNSREGEFSLADFRGLPELFVCNSVVGIWPISRWQDKNYPVGDITHRLQQAVKAPAVVR